jgi:putative membrane protein
MSAALLIVGSVFIFLAAVLHLYIFFLESVLWTKPRTWKTFGIPSQEHADIIQPMAFNQGFYNVFLALGAGVGLATIGINFWFGVALMLFASLSMFFAGVVLFFSTKTSKRSALLQGLPPLVGVVLVLIGIATAG